MEKRAENRCVMVKGLLISGILMFFTEKMIGFLVEAEGGGSESECEKTKRGMSATKSKPGLLLSAH